MRTHAATAKSSASLVPVVAATKKLWRQYHLTYDRTHYVGKAVRRALAIERPKTRTRARARLSRELAALRKAPRSSVELALFRSADGAEGTGVERSVPDTD
jgi:hypothetical protein